MQTASCSVHNRLCDPVRFAAGFFLRCSSWSILSSYQPLAVGLLRRGADFFAGAAAFLGSALAAATGAFFFAGTAFGVEADLLAALAFAGSALFFAAGLAAGFVTAALRD